MNPLQTLQAAVDLAVTAAERARAMVALSVELARRGQASQAMVLAERARELVRPLGQAQLDAQAVHACARARFYQADYAAALQELLQAATLYQTAGDLCGLATAYAGIGLCQHRMGADDDAIDTMVRALDSARGQGLTTLEINLHNSLCAALWTVDRLSEAAHHVDLGIALATRHGDRNLLSKLLMNQSLLALRQADAAADGESACLSLRQGLAHVEDALALFRELGNPYDEAHGEGQRGIVLRRLGALPEARAALQRAWALATELEDTLLRAEAAMELGRLHRVEDRDAEAMRWFEQAIAMARSVNDRRVLAQSCQALAGLHEGQGRLGEALEYFKQFHELRENDLAGARRHAAAAAQVWLDYRDAQREAEHFKARAALLESDHARMAANADRLTDAAQRDPLTLLNNRRGLEAALPELLASAESGALPMTLAIVDIDLFKQVNDRHSHKVGDAVLQAVALAMRGQVRQQDLTVRWGGDEFLLVLPGTADRAAVGVLERLVSALRSWDWGAIAPGLSVTLSIGVAQRQLAQDWGGWFDAADAALREAKSSGRDRICVFGAAPAATAPH